MLLFSYLLMSGITTGALYALVALGLVVVNKATGIINFAQGELFMFCGFVGWMVHVQFGLAYPFAFLIAVAAGFTLGCLTDRIAFRPLIKADVVSLVLATVGLAFVLRGAARMIWGGKGDYLSFPPITSPDPIMLGSLMIIPQQVAVLAGAVTILLAFAAFFRFTRAGKMMRATADNAESGDAGRDQDGADLHARLRDRRGDRRRCRGARGAPDPALPRYGLLVLPEGLCGCRPRRVDEPARRRARWGSRRRGRGARRAATSIRASWRSRPSSSSWWCSFCARPDCSAPPRRDGSEMAPFGRRNVLLILFAVAALVPAFANPYHLFVSNLVLIYVLLAIGLNILVGSAGQLAFANAAMFGIGAYGTALLQVKLGWPFCIAFPAGALLATAVGLRDLTAGSAPQRPLPRSVHARLRAVHAVGVPALGKRDLRRGRLQNAADLVRAAARRQADRALLSQPAVRASSSCSSPRTCSPRGSAAPSSPCVTARLRRSRSGVDLLRYKALAFGISGFYAGIAGGLYSQLLNFVSPEGFDLFQMVLQKAMVVIGGLGSVAGSVLGAGVVILLLEALREFKGAQEIVFGGLLIVFVIFLRGGLVAVIQRHVRGWEEPLHGARPGRASAARPASPVADRSAT